MHINDLSIGMYGANGVVGAGIPIALGTAFANKYRGNDNVSVGFFGDGASNIGTFHESANMAAVMGLPMIFFCENNGYAEFTPQAKHMLLTDVADRAASYGMPGVICDGMDVLEVRTTMQQAVERARSGGGPTLIEAKTYRFYDHQGVKGLRKTYRTPEEIEAWKLRDPIALLEVRGTQDGLVPAEAFAAIWEDVRAEVAESIEYAHNSPLPNTEDFDLNVYSD
jgi:pyruvate dehydrogenase E1 component alpha subunit